MSQNEIGSVEMVIAMDGGMVVQRFKEPMQVVKYEPQNAIDVAMAMTDAAFEARDGVKPAGATLKAELIDRHRMTLTQRFVLVLNTLRRDSRKSDGEVSKQLVEIALKEIF